MQVEGRLCRRRQAWHTVEQCESHKSNREGGYRMASQEHVDLLKQGARAWNIWRGKHLDIRPDLSEANLSVANLSVANLSRADLSRADLNRANLSVANLSVANLGRAYLMGVDLNRADLIEADLNGADLSGAYLMGAYLMGADLGVADLSGANLSGANLSGANLSGANLSDAIIGETILDNLDLRTVTGLETVRHRFPSGITTRTLERSQGDIPEVFLRGVGLSDTFITYVRSLVARPIEYYTCFLSYSNKDQEIVDRLYADLQSKGVRCWYAPHKLKPGDYYRHEIEQSIRVYDKLVLVLSEHSIESEWVEKEVETALKREDSMDMTKQVLFPLRLDDAVLQCRRAWVRSLRYHRHIADFTGWKQHDTYREQFERLLSHLKAGTFERAEP
jgi:hypothetical protein